MSVIVRVFDPAMCCSTGICGPSVDPQLARFAADLDWLKSQGVAVERFNLSQQPAVFAGDATVKAALETKGEAGLPLVKVNGEVKSSGVYPSRDELAAWAGVSAAAPSLFTEAVAELVAIGAAIASNCEPCFRFHYDKARKLGVSREDMLRAVTTAQNVKDAPAKAILDLAERTLRRETFESTAAPATSSETAPMTKSEGCCGPAKAEESAPKAKTEETAPKAKSGGCCGPAKTEESGTKKSGGCC
jgi:AhpD family alkylhydroperoxidase